tara:strand:- start:281 stop:631 length:351 start_codon:yes stop_codon:yes gene_type:complete
MSNKKTKATKDNRTTLKNNKRNTTTSIWGNNNSNTTKKKTTTTSIAPKKRTAAVKAKYAPKKGSIAEKVVNTIVPKTATEAVTMIAGGGIVKHLGKVGSKLYQGAKAIKKVKTTAG